jgi:hypothetical protein
MQWLLLFLWLPARARRSIQWTTRFRAGCAKSTPSDLGKDGEHVRAALPARRAPFAVSPIHRGLQGRCRQEGLATLSWEQLFFDPIELPDGRALRGLRDAGEFIQSLPAAVQDRPEWRTATEALLLVVKCNSDCMLAHIGITRASNAGKSTMPAAPRRKAVKRYRAIGFSDCECISAWPQSAAQSRTC